MLTTLFIALLAELYILSLDPRFLYFASLAAGESTRAHPTIYLWVCPAFLKPNVALISGNSSIYLCPAYRADTRSLGIPV